ncbi:MAG: GyrI-like domain-containing protein [Candidatus Hodarchaeales archaeon]
MTKIDLKKKFEELYSAPTEKPKIVEMPQQKYLMIDGQGYPGTSQEYQDAIQTLYPVAYTLKFKAKKQGKDYVVMPLEGLWWADDMNVFLTEGDKDLWKWTSMIMQPDFITKEMFEESLVEVKEKKNPKLLSKLRFETLDEGKCAQIMHIGPYSEEKDTIEKLYKFILEEQKGTFDGLKHKHHEIYLSDPRRIKPERLRTIIRQPFE